MSNRLPLVRTAGELRKTVQGWRKHGEKVALVPTMGALHDGHLSLIKLAKKYADRVVVSVFVNPTQFAPHEDYNSYPRTEEQDWHKLAAGGADAMYAPNVHEIYPGDFATRVEVAGVTQTLEGISRPHFFSGVTTIVAKLFLQCLPDVALFGEKDYQQLLVIKRMVKDLNFPIVIVPGPILREPDGLAMSSRNVYLDARERGLAPQLHAVIKDMAFDLVAEREVEETLAQGVARLESAGFRVDYLEIRDAETLLPLEGIVRQPARVLAAVYLGRVRLIDNFAVIPE
ncbi:pantoate--beta-alanine ligase [Rhodomicrobium vannielii ATCC 17100]|jgi:pantoate--beta-alanine ligase|uniref:pantoate--beta-alanine ligase n=1 Tax=Rhodomicrobium vannielii TaxID=1069 RepID=UPI00191846AF|nr:pantoate--beta-alanine ligase [Rhodomicrobium vannielii]MBJ7533970.1 pantoate--beta-alanine ligase [Rhodomicrobium vannielii ATCC 17100]